MKLNLTKPLVVFDLETTGLDIVKDRVIQISYIKVMPDGTEYRKNLFVNPGRPIPPEVVEITGITNDMVKDAPTFKQLSQTLSADFTGCDFAGFNSNHFDIPMLAEEFLRAGIDFDFSKSKMIDAQTIFELDEAERAEMPQMGDVAPNGKAVAYGKRTKRKKHFTPDTMPTQASLFGDIDHHAPAPELEDWEGERVNRNLNEELSRGHIDDD